MLSNLDNRIYDVVLFQSNSDKLRIFVQDKLKLNLSANQDTMMDIKTTKDLKQVKEVLGIVPPFAEKWYIVVHLTKSVGIKELLAVINQSTTCVFFIITEKYADYKRVKEGLKNVDIVELYMPFLRKYDFQYLYDALVPKDKQMEHALYNYLVQSYSGDVEQVMNLFIKLNEGVKVKNRNQIAEICGIGGLSIESFVFSMLVEPPSTEKGLKLTMKRRIQAIKELGGIHTYPTLYSFMHKCIYNLVQIKMLKDTGVIYKSIRNLPDAYDTMVLTRYQRYLYTLSEIPLSRLLRLENSMGKWRWKTELELAEFVYNYYISTYKAERISIKKGKS